LIDQGGIGQVMSVAENLAFLQEQRKIFKALLDNEKQEIVLKERRVRALQENAKSLRNRIRAIHRTLVSDDRLPSYAAIKKQVELVEQVDELSQASARFEEILDAFAEHASVWKRLEERKLRLPHDNLSSEDKSKLDSVEESFKDQLEEYDVTSLRPHEVTLSRDSYFPVHEGFDLHFDLSASDGIRFVWAFILSFLEVARKFDTNHAGFVLFDEPRQQSTKGESLRQFLQRASRAKEHGQQVIVATSEEEGHLKGFLSGLEHEYHSYPGRMITPMS
jgi:hypothetical protein